MSTQASGRVVDENGGPLGNLVVTLQDVSMLWKTTLDTKTTDQSTGNFSLGPYASDSDFNGQISSGRKLALRIYTQAHRLLAELPKDDISNATLPFGNITIQSREVKGYTVTLGGSTNALPLRDGNAIEPLVDDEDAWNRIKDAMLGATKSIDIMQLEFDMPAVFNPAPPQENPEIVVSFDGPVDPVNPRPVTKTTDFRPERILIDQAQHGLPTRIILPKVKMDWKNPVLDLLLPIEALLVWIFNSVSGTFSHVSDYFKAASSTADVESFPVIIFNRVHAKMVMVDATELTRDAAKIIVTSSPYCQSYWDTHSWDAPGHHVFEPRRGSASGEPVPVHDVSLGVRGPALKDMHDAFRLHWNSVVDNLRQVEPIPLPSTINTPKSGESIASLQLVRTINGGAFPDLPDGEKGVLEAYLRAIEVAKKYIYFENQYFTNNTIGEALVAALNDTARPNLQIIILLNVTPDIPLYPVWQSNLIERIRKDAKANASRIGFFTLWTHDPPIHSAQLDQKNPMIMANYVHSKVGIVDNEWATVGSANLDGASLDATELVHLLQFGDNRNHELNYIIQDNQSSPGAVDTLRLALWSEHLGINPSDQSLNFTNQAGFLELWKKTAEKKRSGLVAHPSVINPANGRVLEYPANAKTGLPLLLPWVHPRRNFLESSGIKFDSLDLIEHTRSFNFHDGKWT